VNAPRHLWSGDWERDSALWAEELAGSQTPVQAAQAHTDEPTVPPPRTPRRPRVTLRWPPRIVVLLVLAALLTAGVAWGASAVLSSGGSPPVNSVQSASAPWLGAELESLSTGGVAIETVAPGSPAEQAGLEPGDVINEIEHRPITGLSDIYAAIASRHAGDTVEIQVSRGSTIYTARAILASRPSPHP
jgi:membrane-associated protease RseP (regulator of RpoE activity)